MRVPTDEELSDLREEGLSDWCLDELADMHPAVRFRATRLGSSRTRVGKAHNAAIASLVCKAVEDGSIPPFHSFITDALNDNEINKPWGKTPWCRQTTQMMIIATGIQPFIVSMRTASNPAYLEGLQRQPKLSRWEIPT